MNGDPITRREERMLVIRQVAKTHGVSVHDLLGRRRAAWLVAARRAAIRAIHDQFDDSLPMIARLFRRDHTTILYHLRGWKRRRPKGDGHAG